MGLLDDGQTDDGHVRDLDVGLLILWVFDGVGELMVNFGHYEELDEVPNVAHSVVFVCQLLIKINNIEPKIILIKIIIIL